MAGAFHDILASRQLSCERQIGRFHVELLPVASLLPTEQYEVDRLAVLVDEIRISKVWTIPILAEHRSLAVMDGHHRRSAAQLLGLARVPVVRLSYDDPRLYLTGWRKGHTFKPEDILSAAHSGCLLPIKSTRHVLSVELPQISIALDSLRDGA